MPQLHTTAENQKNELKLLDDTKNILHTYYICQRRFANWSLQTYTIIVPIKFAEVVQKSVENLEKGRVHEMLIERMHHQHHVIQVFLSFSLKNSIHVNSMSNLLREDHLRSHEIDGKYTEPVFPKHM